MQSEENLVMLFIGLGFMSVEVGKMHIHNNASKSEEYVGFIRPL